MEKKRKRKEPDDTKQVNKRPPIHVEMKTPKDMSSLDKWNKFTKTLFLNASMTEDGTPDEPSNTLVTILDYQNSAMALRMLRSLAGAEGR